VLIHHLLVNMFGDLINYTYLCIKI